MQRRIKCNLTVDSVNQAINELKDYRKHVRELAMELGQELVEQGVHEAKTWIIAMGAFETGSLLDSIEGFFDPWSGKGFIKTDCNHAAYVEYGTGVRGEEEKPYGVDPNMPEGWEYDKNNHGHYGWYYGKDNRRWTKGMPPRPFMYKTFLELCDRASEQLRAKYNG